MTTTVGELIVWLQRMPADAPVLMHSALEEQYSVPETVHGPDADGDVVIEGT